MSTFMAGANGMLGLRHPALVRVVLVDREMDYSVVGYEALPGAESMTDVVTSGSSRILLARTALEVARGLAFLHRRGMLHGALTPSTVVMWEGVPVLWEHGIAALCSHAVFGPRASKLGGDVVAPEVRAGAQLTPATDVFAWAAVLSSVATGVLGPEAVASVVAGEVDEGRQGPLFSLIREALAPEPAGRPRDGTHLLERLLALEEVPRPTPTKVQASADAVDDEDLSNLARRYLAEMSDVEKRPRPSRPLPEMPDGESSGALAKIKLRKAKVPTGAFSTGVSTGQVGELRGQHQAAARDRVGEGQVCDAGAPTWAEALDHGWWPRPQGLLPEEPLPEDSAAQGVPLWKAASESRPRRVSARPPEPDPAPDAVAGRAERRHRLRARHDRGGARKWRPRSRTRMRWRRRPSCATRFSSSRRRRTGRSSRHKAESSHPSLANVPDDPTGAPRVGWARPPARTTGERTTTRRPTSSPSRRPRFRPGLPTSPPRRKPVAGCVGPRASRPTPDATVETRPAARHRTSATESTSGPSRSPARSSRTRRPRTRSPVVGRASRREACTRRGRPVGSPRRHRPRRARRPRAQARRGGDGGRAQGPEEGRGQGGQGSGQEGKASRQGGGQARQEGSEAGQGQGASFRTNRSRPPPQATTSFPPSTPDLHAPSRSSRSDPRVRRGPTDPAPRC